MAIYCAVLLVFMEYSGAIIELKSGFIICRSDCADFHRFSDFLVQTGRQPPFKGDWHAGPFFRGYVTYVAAIKYLFGAMWPAVYVAVNGILAVWAIYLSVRLIPSGQAAQRILPFGIGVLFLLANPGMLIYSKFLLADYMFGVGMATIMTLLAVGFGDRRKGCIFAGILILCVFTFFKPNSLILWGVVFWLFAGLLLARKTGDGVMVLAPVFAGMVAILISVSITNYWVANYAALSEVPTSVVQYFENFLRHNYTGSDSVQPSNRLGANLWTFPHHNYSYNDGSWFGILGSVMQRILYSFQIGLPGYSPLHNTYRYLYYSVLYVSFLSFAVTAIHQRKVYPAAVLLITIWAGYYLALMSLSPIEIRYRLGLETVMVICGSIAIADHWSRLKLAKYRR